MKYMLSVLLINMLVLPAVQAEVVFRESDLATLFTTPKLRHQIDMKRSGMAAAESGKQSQRVTPSKIRVNGIVKSSKGKSIVWINGKSSDGSSTVNGVKVLAKRSQARSVQMLVDGRLVKVKPGESWSENESE